MSERISNGAANNPDAAKWDSLKDAESEAAKNVASQTIRVPQDRTGMDYLKSEFERITGEKWPGVKYEAVWSGQSGYDYDRTGKGGTDGIEDYGDSETMMEVYAIRERVPQEGEKKANKAEEIQGKKVDEFQVAPGTTKEEEFERITGEKWPGKRYRAYNIDLIGGDDYPIEIWGVYDTQPDEAPEQAQETKADDIKTEAPEKPKKSKKSEKPKASEEESPSPKYLTPEEKRQKEFEEWKKHSLERAKERLAYEKWLQSRDAENMRNLEETGRTVTGKGRIKKVVGVGETTSDTQPQPKDDEKISGNEETPEKRDEDKAEEENDGIVGQVIKGIPQDKSGWLELEREFERITGEKWPGSKYEAVATGNSVYDNDGTSETLIADYVIRRRDGGNKTPKPPVPPEPDPKDPEPPVPPEPPEPDPKQDELDPLIAINADFTHDRAELAHDLAERELNTETSKANFIKRLWKGSLFKKYFEFKYTREFLYGSKKNGQRTVDVNGEQLTVDELIERRSAEPIKRFILGATEDMRYVHERAGEKLTEADTETTVAIRSVIEKFASDWAKNNASAGDLHDNKELKLQFKNEVNRVLAELRAQGKPVNEKMIGNLYEVAIQASERAAHDVSMDRVMEGFKVYNADVRDSVRSEPHRQAIDKLFDKFESSALGQRTIPLHILALGATTAWSLSQTAAKMGARALAGTGAGIVIGGALAGLQERNRVTEDRARRLRDEAMGLKFDDEGKTRSEMNRVERKRAKYEAKIGGTIYDNRPAAELTRGIMDALDSGDEDTLMRAIAEAKVRTSFSDSEQKDLISYSSADKIGAERLALDTALIRAEKRLSEDGKKQLELMTEVIDRKTNAMVAQKDQEFYKLRNIEAAKKAGKTILIGGILHLASQELMALFDPAKKGFLEEQLRKTGILKTQDNVDAKATILAHAAGEKTYTETATQTRIETSTNTVYGVNGDETERIEELEKSGFKKVTTKPARDWTETKKDFVDGDATTSPSRVNQVTVFAHNNTAAYDYTEQMGDLEKEGFYMGRMFGKVATMDAESFDIDETMKSGNVLFKMTTKNGAVFLAKVNPDGFCPVDANGYITDVNGTMIKAVENGTNALKYGQFVIDRGVNADGVRDLVSLATMEGTGATDTVREVVDTLVEHHEPAVYAFTKTIEKTVPYTVERVVDRGVFYGGVSVNAPSRVGLGGTRPRNQEQVPEPTAPEAPAKTPEEQVPEPTTPEGQPVAPERLTPEDIKTAAEALIMDGDVEDAARHLIAGNKPFDADEEADISRWLGGLSKIDRDSIRDYVDSHPDEFDMIRVILDTNYDVDSEDDSNSGDDGNSGGNFREF